MRTGSHLLSSLLLILLLLFLPETFCLPAISLRLTGASGLFTFLPGLSVASSEISAANSV